MNPNRSKKTHETTIFSFSHSGLSTMEKCPREWFWRYIAGIRPNIKKEATEFGSLSHKLAENYTGTGVEEAKKLVDEYSKEFQISEKYKEKISYMISNFLMFHDTHLTSAKKVYKEKEIRVPLNEYIDLLGNIDVLYKTDTDEWVIVDYKTSKGKKDETKQLALYFYLLTLISPKKPKSIRCKAVYLSLEDKKSPIIDEYVLSDDELSFCESRLESAMNRIAAFGVEKIENWKKKPSKLCNYCDYFIASYCDGKTHE